MIVFIKELYSLAKKKSAKAKKKKKKPGNCIETFLLGKWTESLSMQWSHATNVTINQQTRSFFFSHKICFGIFFSVLCTVSLKKLEKKVYKQKKKKLYDTKLLMRHKNFFLHLKEDGNCFSTFDIWNLCHHFLPAFLANFSPSSTASPSPSPLCCSCVVSNQSSPQKFTKILTSHVMYLSVE